MSPYILLSFLNNQNKSKASNKRKGHDVKDFDHSLTVKRIFFFRQRKSFVAVDLCWNSNAGILKTFQEKEKVKEELWKRTDIAEDILGWLVS